MGMINHCKKLLILGGTAEATALYNRVKTMANIEAIASFAGRTQQPVTPTNPAAFRIGGFGGVQGLIDYLKQQKIDILIDVTHPFAAQISDHGAIAANECGIKRLMVVRPAWEKVPGDNWVEVDSHSQATMVLPGLAERVFLTIGRQELSAYAEVKNIWFLMRMIDPPQPNLPIPRGELLLQRGPFSVVDELSILREYQLGAIVSKNSGGDSTYAKIVAARELKLPVVMVQRPPVPMGETVADIESAIAWLQKQ